MTSKAARTKLAQAETQPQFSTWNDYRVWAWPGVIAASCLIAGGIILSDSSSSLRPVIMLWFVVFCPGFAFTRLLGLDDPLSEISLAAVTSVSISSIVAGVLLYSGTWSITTAILVLICVSLFGLLLQFWDVWQGVSEK